jgi:uncharacterized membrane protein (UPF0136 family)
MERNLSNKCVSLLASKESRELLVGAGDSGQVEGPSSRVHAMQTTAMEIWAYGVIMILGGIMGYVKVRSKASLLSGVGMGLALLASGYGVWQGSRESLVVSVVIAALLVVLFAIRLAKTRRFMPLGVLAILSLAAVVIFGMALKK